MALYTLENVTQRYGNREVLRIPHLAIEEGAAMGLRGHNGSGKSTLLRILAFLETPATGRIIFDGVSSPGNAFERRRHVTLLTQEPYLLTTTVRKNVAYGMKIRGMDNVDESVDKALSQVGLDPERFAGRSAHELSGGELQRVALAARLAMRPRVLLLDEPTASLDKDSAVLIKNAVTAARTELGTTLVIASHDMSWLESVSDSMLCLYEGQPSERDV
ncbi:ABC transporter ATP-binding protein [Oceanidesulfovibrio indonesiensis]|uniref:ABC transporter ATP-binding protein n=1 Tax=Oceanidesulfovibrio indonesiensis TaxID=54767 RepID=A0A7M3MFV0_9BACT|nr:ABC transporter ATP-binding protein [Oceanidesulfovibrio indonesiensis]TVM17628.1 ABC transporter ATP-binding protein [Oceanidesulfovibrio indonesiensis]